MIKLIPYEPEHMDLFEQTEEDIARYGVYDSKTPNPMAEYGTCFTAIADGRIVVVGGILQMSTHTGKCWTMVSKHASKCGISVFRMVKNQLEAMMQAMKMHRVETANIETAEEHHKWCRLLGFQQEGKMKYYDDEGRTYIRFAKFMEVN